MEMSVEGAPAVERVGRIYSPLEPLVVPLRVAEIVTA
jgi:hypothetical protein